MGIPVLTISHWLATHWLVILLLLIALFIGGAVGASAALLWFACEPERRPSNAYS